MNRAVPSTRNSNMPAIIHRTAQGDGSSRRLAERSIRRLFNSLSMLYIFQCRQYFCLGRGPGREKTAERSHDQCESDSYRHDFRADSEIERNLAERHKAADACCDVVER